MENESDKILDILPPPCNARLAYGPQESQFGELRLPVGRGKHPVAIVLHGGFWRVRYGLDYLGHLCAALARAGVATWNVEYRRLGQPGAGWPGTFQDVVQAARHLQRLAQQYPLDLDRVIAAGHSAGGQLALWLAAAGRFPPGSPLHNPHPFPLRGVVSLAGVVDLRRAWELGLSREAARELLGGSPLQHAKRYAQISPYELLPIGILQLLVHGVQDADVPFELSQRYVEKARMLGEPIRWMPLPDAGHFELIDPASRQWLHIQAAMLSLFT